LSGRYRHTFYKTFFASPEFGGRECNVYFFVMLLLARFCSARVFGRFSIVA